MLRRRRFYVIYPEYFDKDLSRSEGRRVALDISANEPNIKKIELACRELQKKYDFQYQLQPEKAHPSRYWEQNGRVLISIDKKNKVPKGEIVHDMADIIRRIVKKKSSSKKKGKSGQSERTPSAKRRKPSSKSGSSKN